MPQISLMLITGRSTKQGTGISTGKERAEYKDATNMHELSPFADEGEGAETC
jgi:formylmethanofuran dehydrogenase subunit D